MSIPSGRRPATLVAAGLLVVGLAPGVPADEVRKRPARTYSNADLPARQPAPVPAPPAASPAPTASPTPAASSDGTAARPGADWSVAAWETRLAQLRSERQAAERKVAELEERLARLGFELLDLPDDAAEKAREQLTQVRVDLGAAREGLAAIRASQPGLVEKARICGVPEARATQLVAP